MWLRPIINCPFLALRHQFCFKFHRRIFNRSHLFIHVYPVNIFVVTVFSDHPKIYLFSDGPPDEETFRQFLNHFYIPPTWEHGIFAIYRLRKFPVDGDKKFFFFQGHVPIDILNQYLWAVYWRHAPGLSVGKLDDTTRFATW